MLKVTNLETTYKDVILALRGISLEVPPGKIIVLLGANGAGKTTTINTVSGIRRSLDLKIEDGTVEFEGEIINAKEPYQIVERGLLQVPEGRRVFAELTVEENIIISSYTIKDRKKFLDNREMVWSYFPILKSRRSQEAGYLSGGEQQMLVIGRALMAQPKLIMMDEPSLGLAPLLVKEIFQIIGRINSQENVAILLVEQNANVALGIADHGYILENGRIVMEGAGDTLQADRDIKEFYLGLSELGHKKKIERSETLQKKKAMAVLMNNNRPLQLEIEDVSISFGGVSALSGVSLNIGKGEIYSIIGPNGAGKTTLFNCVSGIYKAQEGSIRFDGKEIMGMKPHKIAKMGIARAFQNIALFERMSVLDNLMSAQGHNMKYGLLASALYWGRCSREEIKSRDKVEEVIEFLDLQHLRKSSVGSLPYGLQKRVELGRALAMEPRLLLVDEPVSGMNIEETEDMARYVLDINEEMDITVVLVEHDMGMVMELSDKVTVLNFGIKIAEGSPEEVSKTPEVISAYLG